MASLAAPDTADTQAPAGEPKKSRPGHFKVTTAEVLLAVESLYADRLQPYGRILLKRLSERALAQQIGAAALARHTKKGLPQDLVPQIDKGRLRRVCEKCKSLRVVSESGGEYTALLVGRECPFIDACSPEDPYPKSFWESTKAFFRSPAGKELRLPGGRYACAQALVASELPFLAGRSLGEVAHIVQLAISHKSLLGYDDGHVVPYDCSEAVIKQRCAALQLPVSDAKKEVQAIPVASLERARECLQLILMPSEGQVCEVPLPNVKRLFRSRFSVELSETSLGHSRLCDLLQDERFSDICALRFHGNGYIVSPRVAEPAAQVAEEAPACVRSRSEPWSGQGLEAKFEAEVTEADVSRTFIHFAQPKRSAARRTKSLPRNHRLDSAWLSEASTCGCSSTDSQCEMSDDWSNGIPDTFEGDDWELPPHLAMPTPSPRCSPSGVRCLGLDEDRFACFDTETLQYEHEAEQTCQALYDLSGPLETVAPVPYPLSLFAACQLSEPDVFTPSGVSTEDAFSDRSTPGADADAAFSACSWEMDSLSPRSQQKETFRSRTPSPEYPRASFDHFVWRELPSVSLYGPR